MGRRAPNDDDDGKPGAGGAPFRFVAAMAMLWLAATAVFLFTPQDPGDAPQEVPYSEFKDLLARGELTSVLFDERRLFAEGPPGADGSVPRIATTSPPVDDDALLPLLDAQGIPYESAPPRAEGGGGWIGWLPMLLLIGIWIYALRRMTGRPGGMGLPGLGDGMLGRSWRVRKDDPGVRFADVAGQDAAKREVAELVDFLRDPDRFARVGAQVPRGVLMMGPPGTGKTLLAKALAGEAQVPFFSTSGSAFIEMYVGVGAGRVRKMFEEARKAAPSIVFIDELDSIGRTRGAGLGGGHDEREQTLNQILAELDGFDERVAVVVLAATNRPDVLDPALLRPGRFDRHVTLSLPDRDARRAILDVHARNVKLAADADLDVVAAGTPGFSGADLKNLINEAAIAAARARASSVGARDLDAARDRVIMGTVRTLAISPTERRRIAVHEAGHAAAAFLLPGADPVYKVTIIPRGRSLGGTHMLPEEERHTMPESVLRTQLAVMLAGRAAERLLLGEASSGADDDIARATRLARAMVAQWGMDEQIGPVDLRRSEEHPFLGREIARASGVSEDAARRVDAAVGEALHQAQGAAERCLRDHRDGLERLVDRLEAEETLDHAAVEQALNGPSPSRAAV